jgi:hypothetical protein
MNLVIVNKVLVNQIIVNLVIVNKVLVNQIIVNLVIVNHFLQLFNPLVNIAITLDKSKIYVVHDVSNVKYLRAYIFLFGEGGSQFLLMAPVWPIESTITHFFPYMPCFLKK